MMWVYTLLPKILNMSRRIINGSPLAFGECNIEDRIENVLNFKKPAAWVIVVSVALVAALSMGLAMNGASKLELPDADDVLSIELEQFNNYETTGHTVISDKTQINNILNAMSGAAKTLSQSVNDYPIADNYLVVRLNLANKRKTLCLHKDGGNFIEEPYIGIYRARSKFNYVYAVYDAYLHGTNKPLSGETNSDEPLIFASDETDLIKLGTLAFDTYMDYRMSEKTPISERIASYKLNNISVLAGDINEFCVSLNFEITTNNDSYQNPALGAKGKGTWPDNYMEIRVKYAYENVYSIKSIGAGGGGQGLVPYIAEHWEFISKADVNWDGWDEDIYLDKTQMESNHDVKLCVLDSGGNEIWNELANTTHAGWNSVFLCQLEGKYYVLRYNPGMWQGYCSYTYTLFTLEGGKEKVYRTKTLEFDINGTKELNASEMVAFADEVNALLEKSTLLLSTEDGSYSFGPSPAEPFLERYSWLDEKTKLFEEGDSLEARLNKYSNYVVSNYCN